MARHTDLDELRGADEEAPESGLVPTQPGPSPEVAAAYESMQRLCAGALDFVVAEGLLASLRTGVVLAVTPGGLVPVFAHVSREIAPVLTPATDNAGRPASATDARARLN